MTNRLSKLAAKAGNRAYQASMKNTGGALVRTAKGLLVERNVDGTFKVLKQLGECTSVVKGSVLKQKLT